MGDNMLNYKKNRGHYQHSRIKSSDLSTAKIPQVNRKYNINPSYVYGDIWDIHIEPAIGFIT